MSKNNSYCRVPECKSWSKRNLELRFHKFPTVGRGRVYFENKLNGRELIDRQKAWVLKLKIGKSISRFMKVCSLHFRKEDFFSRNNDTTARNYLKKDAVLSKNLPVSAQSATTSRRK